MVFPFLTILINSIYRFIKNRKNFYEDKEVSTYILFTTFIGHFTFYGGVSGLLFLFLFGIGFVCLVWGYLKTALC